jgi:putative hydrolase
LGPASLRIAREVIDTGRSDAVDRAVQGSAKRADVERRRTLRGHFLSRARVLEILAHGGKTTRMPIRGDLQMHSTWSDGGEPIATLARGCQARGYEYCAVTDHSYGLPIAGGVSMANIARQHKEIDRLNARLDGQFRVIKGIEANILANGDLDIQPDERREFEIIVAAPHSKLRLAEDQTARMVAAVKTTGAHILGHPRGRVYSSRAGVQADWPTVFEAAADAGVAIEIDGDPSRQDLDHTLAAAAKRAGCLFALDSDAHGTGDLWFTEIARAHAFLAGISAARIINTWPVEQLLDWARTSRGRRRRVRR